MTLVWDQNPNYEAGVDRAVLYSGASSWVWNGLVSVEQKTPGGELTEMYFDGIKYFDLSRAEFFNAVLGCFTYPDYFDVMIQNQRHYPFNLTYRTKTANGYKIHLVYNATAKPVEMDYGTLNQNPTVTMFGFDLETNPVTVPNATPTAHLIVDSSVADPRNVAALEALLYGTSSTAPSFPTATAVKTIFDNYPGLVVTDFGDGSFQIDGPSYAVIWKTATEWEVTWPSAYWLSSDTYEISTL